MNAERFEKKDLIILAADKDCKTALSNLLKKPRRLGIRSISSKILEMPRGEADPGCRKRGHDILRTFSTQYQHAILIFDLEGCGAEKQSAVQLEEESEGIKIQFKLKKENAEKLNREFLEVIEKQKIKFPIQKQTKNDKEETEATV